MEKLNHLNVNGNMRRRILDLGIVEGTNIKPVLRSPLGDPTAYEVRGSIIAIRKDDAKLIFIES